MRLKIFCVLLAMFGAPLVSLARPILSSQFHGRQLMQSSTSRLVFAHYMVLTRPVGNNYTNDITSAKAAGIDAFALNYGGYGVDWNVQQGYLADIYSAAQANSFSVFISFDTTSVPNASMCVDLANKYASNSAQLYVDNKMLLSSFQTNDPSWSWKTDVLDKITVQTMFLPGTLSDAASSIFNTEYDGIFTWIHPTKIASDESTTDEDYASARTTYGKKWMAAIAPWYFKRFDANDNWAHAQDQDIFISRFQHLLALQPDFIELITWNDWGESSYLGPADTTELVPTAYWDTLDHSGFLTIASLFIKAYKSGATNLTIDASAEQVYLFYRLQPGGTNGSSDTLPLPLDYQYLKDDVYVATFLASAADIAVTSGGQTTSFTAQAGVTVTAVPWTLGAQSLKASRNGASFVTKSGGPSISGSPTKYNGNVVII